MFVEIGYWVSRFILSVDGDLALLRHFRIQVVNKPREFVIGYTARQKVSSLTISTGANPQTLHNHVRRKAKAGGCLST